MNRHRDYYNIHHNDKNRIKNNNIRSKNIVLLIYAQISVK